MCTHTGPHTNKIGHENTEYSLACGSEVGGRVSPGCMWAGEMGVRGLRGPAAPGEVSLLGDFLPALPGEAVGASLQSLSSGN